MSPERALGCCHTLIAGIGSPILGDDGVGIHVVRELARHPLPPDVRIAEVGTGGLALVDLLAGTERLIAIDAAVTGAAAGSVHVWGAAEVSRTVHLGATNHEADLPTALHVAKRLLHEQMPRDVVVLGVEAIELCRFSESLSPAVQAAVPAVVAEVRALLARPR